MTRRGWKLVGLLLLALLGLRAQQRHAARWWLNQARTAAVNLSYQGRQRLHLETGGQSDDYDVTITHQAPDRTRREFKRPSEAGFTVTTIGAQSWRSDATTGRVERLAAPDETTPPDLPSRCRLRCRRGPRVAGHDTQRVMIVTRAARSELLLDRATGLVLASRRREAGGARRDTEFETFSFDPPSAAIEPPAGAARHGSEAMSAADLSRRLGFAVTEPSHLPRGYRLVGSYLYRCPCCGMEAAQLVYADGAGWLSVFEQAKAAAGCLAGASCCAQATAAGGCVGGSCDTGQLVARLDRDPVVVAMGDVGRAELTAVARSLP
jgi:hypothetical protein